jgi:hypothetical protein
VVDLDSLLGHPGAVGGEAGGAEPLAPAACRRLACDGALTRVLVTRQPTTAGHPRPCQGAQGATAPGDPGGEPGLAERLRAALAVLPPILGGAPRQPLDLGRASRVITPPNAPPSRSATAAVSSPTALGRWAGARATTWSTGSTAAPPTWPTWPCCAGPIIGRSTRAAGGWPAAPTVA